MADIPQPRSYNQILGEMLDAFLSKTGLTSIVPGSPTLSFLEAGSQSDLRNDQDIFNSLDVDSLDRCSGSALDRKGAQEKTPRITQKPANGPVTVTDTSFSKISTTIFQGLGAPIAGVFQINLTSAILFPSSGSIYLGRGTSNYEGPIAYTSAPVNNGSYWTITLNSATQNYHNVGETVVLAQGGVRTINSGTIVQIPPGNTVSAITYLVTYAASIPDGETFISGIQVSAQIPGTTGNVPAGAISQFQSLPFTGATVSNPSPFSNGLPTEKDPDYRQRIKNAIASRTKGTSLAVTNSVLGITDPNEQKSVTSSSIVRSSGLSTLYIDDGSGYEETDLGIAVETLADQALGGESYFQLADRPVAKAFIETSLAAPFTLANGMQLAVLVGGVLSTHTFDSSTFQNISGATAYEVVASINANSSLLFSARTANSGTLVVIFAKTDTNEDLQVVVPTFVNANTYLGLPSGRVYTINLYKNDILLNKDGAVAEVYSNPISKWGALSGSQTLILAVDQTPAVTYTFVDVDFINANTGYITLGDNSPAAWVKVINNKIPGITAQIVNGLIQVSSNLGTNPLAKVVISGGTLTPNVFPIQTSSGSGSDYALNRNTGEIYLDVALNTGDRLNVGEVDTRAFVQSGLLSTFNVTGTAGRIWAAVDGAAQILPLGITASTSLDIQVVNQGNTYWGNRVRLYSDAGTAIIAGTGSLQVAKNDWLILWDPAINSQNQGAYRVLDVAGNGSYIEMERKGLDAARSNHQSILLNTGNILVIGGIDNLTGNVHTSCELYNPTTNATTPCASLTTERYNFGACLLANGKVLVSGGTDGNGNNLASSELYDPTANTWTVSGAMPANRSLGQLVALSNGNALYIGGFDASLTVRAETYLWTVGSGTWAASGSMITPRVYFNATVMQSGNILAAGGQISGGTLYTNLSEYYVPGTGTWTASTGNMATARSHQASTLMNNHNIAATGGLTASGATGSTEIYNTSTNTWSAGQTLNNTYQDHICVTMANGNLFVSGSNSIGSFTAAPNAEVGATDDSTNPWVNYTSGTTYPAWGFHTSNALASGPVIIFGGKFTNQTRSINYSCAQGAKFTPVGVSPSSTGYFLPVGLTVAQGLTAVPSLAGSTALTLPNIGITAVRTSAELQQINIPIASNYTALFLANLINLQILGATASAYRTNYLRIETNTFTTSGDIAIVAADVEGQLLSLPISGAVSNQVPHLPAIVAQNSDIGTPHFYNLANISQESYGTTSRILFSSKANTGARFGTNLVIPSNITLVGLKPLPDSTGTDSALREGQNYNFESTLYSSTQSADFLADSLEMRSMPTELSVSDRFWAAKPYAIGPNDALTLVLNNDPVNLRYTIPFYRHLSTVGSTYATTNTFTDADNTNQSLAQIFGYTGSTSGSFVFDDFTVYMKARIQSHPSDARTILWRYNRYGSEGNWARIRYDYPIAANQDVQVNVNPLDKDYVDISLTLPSSTARTVPNLHSTTNIGVSRDTNDSGGLSLAHFVLGFSVASASRSVGNVTTLTLTLPSTVAGCGLVAGEQIYLNSSNGSFISGLYVITGSTSNTITYNDTGGAATGTNIGDICFDTTEANLTGSSISVGDIFYINAGTGIASNYTQLALRVKTVGAQYWDAELENGSGSINSGLVWGQLNNTSYISFYPLNAGNSTSTYIANKVNTLAAVTGSFVPVTAKILGAGGNITLSSWEENDISKFWYQLSDGINFVRSTTPPASAITNYQLSFKNPINSALATNSDWADEIVIISPTTTPNLVNWMNVPGVTPLFSNADVETGSRNNALQITSLTPGSIGAVQVQSGTANAVSAAVVGSASFLASNFTGDYSIVSIRNSDSTGLSGGMAVAIQNTLSLNRGSITSSTALSSITSAGLVTLSGTPSWTQRAAYANAEWQIEIQGKLVCYSYTGRSTSIPFLSSVIEGDWVFLSTVGGSGLSTVNCGLFRIVRADILANSFWIENSAAVEAIGTARTVFIADGSILPGDILSIATPLWGINNQGTWTVTAVGASAGIPFSSLDTTSFTLNVSSKTIQASGAVAALGSNYPLIQIIEGTPSRFIKIIHSISQNQSVSNLVDVKFTSGPGYKAIGVNGGSLIQPLDKLNFVTTLVDGVDGYTQSTGLIEQANLVVYGDPQDNQTYPGVIAEGARINISGPIIKRIKTSISIRIGSGNVEDIINSVKSAITSYINQTAVGQPVILSGIITAALTVNGVTSVAIISPTYTSTTDIISLQPYEKALVVDPINDITVSPLT